MIAGPVWSWVWLGYLESVASTAEANQHQPSFLPDFVVTRAKHAGISLKPVVGSQNKQVAMQGLTLIDVGACLQDSFVTGVSREAWFLHQSVYNYPLDSYVVTVRSAFFP